MIIGLTGPKLGGKGTTAEYLQKKYGAVTYSMSGILFDIAQRLYLPTSRENLINIATALRSEFGEDILGKVLKEDIKKADDKIAIIDGIRMPSDVELFSQIPGFILLYINAPIQQRFKRAHSRGEKEGEKDMSFEQFEAEEKAVTEKGITNLLKKANTVIENNGSFDELYEAIKKAIQ